MEKVKKELVGTVVSAKNNKTITVNVETYKKHPLYDFFKKILRLFKKKPQIVYLGEEIKTSSIILSNHVGASGPLAWELYPIFSFRFWGTYEMNSGLKSVYIYLASYQFVFYYLDVIIYIHTLKK